MTAKISFSKTNRESSTDSRFASCSNCPREFTEINRRRCTSHAARRKRARYPSLPARRGSTGRVPQEAFSIEILRLALAPRKKKPTARCTRKNTSRRCKATCVLSRTVFTISFFHAEQRAVRVFRDALCTHTRHGIPHVRVYSSLRKTNARPRHDS